MRLSELKSERLIPFQAHNEDEESIEARLNWVCNAFDDFVHTIDARRLALAAPYSLDVIRRMTDAELQQYFIEFGIAKYYPDIARSAREMMLYNEMRYFRKLGTVAAIEAMVQYIFGENPIALTIHDCLAFDENGVLTDASLYDMYDVIITAENPVLGAFELGRIFANLTRFNRTTQKLRAITMRYSGGECTAYAGAGSVEYAVHYENWEICTLSVRPVTLTVGVDTEVGANATGLDSKYYWFYQFSGGSSFGNLWTPAFYADNVNPSNPDPNDEEIPSVYYNNVWLWDGSQLYDMNGNGATFRLAVYNGLPEFYTSMSVNANGYSSSCLIEIAEGALVFTQDTFSLPADLYTISGTSVSWNTSHPLYTAFYGKTANILYAS